MDDLMTQYGLRPATPWNTPYIPSAEALEELMRSFNQQPLEYIEDPTTGKTVVRRRMERPMGPPDLEPPYQPYFRSPNNPAWNMNAPDLTSSWILPEGAMSGPKFLDTSAPTSAASRQSAYNMGISNVGENVNRPNPQTFWPESSFQVPFRDPSGLEDPYLPPEPVFGSTVDFSRNRYFLPPIHGEWNQTFGQTQGGVPGHGNEPMVGPVIPTEIENRLRQLMLRRIT